MDSVGPHNAFAYETENPYVHRWAALASFPDSSRRGRPEGENGPAKS